MVEEAADGSLHPCMDDVARDDRAAGDRQDLAQDEARNVEVADRKGAATSTMPRRVKWNSDAQAGKLCWMVGLASLPPPSFSSSYLASGFIQGYMAATASKSKQMRNPNLSHFLFREWRPPLAIP